MEDPIKLGIIICDRYRNCAGGKCLRALRSREGAFERYKGRDVELVGFASCNGCPGGNVEYVPQEMKNNGAEIVHLATGMIVGYSLSPGYLFFPVYQGKIWDGSSYRNAPNPPEILRNSPEARLMGLGNMERSDCTNTHG
jgi:predicted metal-binding protein